MNKNLNALKAYFNTNLKYDEETKKRLVESLNDPKVIEALKSVSSQKANS